MLTLEKSVVDAAHQVVLAAPMSLVNRKKPFLLAAYLLDNPSKAIQVLQSVYHSSMQISERLFVPIFCAMACQRLTQIPAGLKDFTLLLLNDQLEIYQQRDFSEDGLPCLLNPEESLLPRAPYWESMEQKDGRWAVQEPIFLALLSWANESLLYLMGRTKIKTPELTEWQELTVYSMNELLWDTEYGIYLPRDYTCGDTVLSGSLGGVVPLIAEIATQDQAEAMRSILQANFLEDSHYYFPTNSIFNQNMEATAIDAGGLDPVLNWLLFFGLLRYDFDDLAIYLRNDMLNLIGEYGFYRYYESERKALGNRGIGAGNNPTTAGLFSHLIQVPLQYPLYS